MIIIELVNRLKQSLGIKPKTLSEKIDDGEEILASGSEIVVTRSVAEKIGALNQGLLLIADTVAGLPIYLYKRDNDGNRERQIDRRNRLLNQQSSPNSSAFNMKQNIVIDYLLHGNGFIDIERDALFKIKALRHIPYHDVILNKSYQVNKRYEIYTYDYWGMTRVPTHDVLNVVRKPKDSELEGIGILKEGNTILSTAIGFEEYTKNSVESGFSAKAVVESEKPMTLESRRSLKESLGKFFGGYKNGAKAVVLDDGMKLKALNLSPADLELLNQKDFGIKDIARLLKLQPSMLGVATGGMTYSNEKDNQLYFLKNTIEPLLRLIEQTFNLYLLTEDEKEQGFFFEFNTQNMLRMSIADEIDMYVKATGGPIMTGNEARRRLNWSPIDGMDKPKIKLDHGVLNEDGTISSHQQNTIESKDTR